MNATELTHAIVLTVVIVGWLAFWIFAIVSIMRPRAMGDFERGIWVAVVILFPFVGPVVWFVWGRARERRGVIDGATH